MAAQDCTSSHDCPDHDRDAHDDIVDPSLRPENQMERDPAGEVVWRGTTSGSIEYYIGEDGQFVFKPAEGTDTDEEGFSWMQEVPAGEDPFAQPIPAEIQASMRASEGRRKRLHWLRVGALGLLALGVAAGLTEATVAARHRLEPSPFTDPGFRHYAQSIGAHCKPSEDTGLAADCTVAGTDVRGTLQAFQGPHQMLYIYVFRHGTDPATQRVFVRIFDSPDALNGFVSTVRDDPRLYPNLFFSDTYATYGEDASLLARINRGTSGYQPIWPTGAPT